VDVTQKRCLDVGSSTGGFTQVLLEHGAAHVDAVDVGTDQLHPTILADARVSSYEQTDIRDFVSREIYDIIVCDASFIMLEEILPSIMECMSAHTQAILLFKPQFQVGKEHIHKKTGLPKTEKSVREAQERFEVFLRDHGLVIRAREKSTS